LDKNGILRAFELAKELYTLLSVSDRLLMIVIHIIDNNKFISLILYVNMLILVIMF